MTWFEISVLVLLTAIWLTLLLNTGSWLETIAKQDVSRGLDKVVDALETIKWSLAELRVERCN
jgi:hypothetical protein